MTMPVAPVGAPLRQHSAVTTLRGLVAALLVVGAGVLVAGVLVERATLHESAPVSAAAPPSTATTAPRGHTDADGGVEGAPIEGSGPSAAAGGEAGHPETGSAGSSQPRASST